MSSFGRYHSNVKITFVSKSEEFLSLRNVSLTLNISDCYANVCVKMSATRS